MEKIIIELKEDEYVLCESELICLNSLRTFSENCFQGYGGKLGEIEDRLLSSFRWLTKEYIELLDTIVKDDRKKLKPLEL